MAFHSLLAICYSHLDPAVYLWLLHCDPPALCQIASTGFPPNKNSREAIMTSPLTFPGTGPLNRRRLMKGAAALAATAVTASASAETVAPLGQTGAPTIQGDALPLGPLQGSRYPDSHLESAKKGGKPTFGPPDFPAFAGTMAVERVATGFRWAEGPVYIPAWRMVMFSDIPNNRIMRFSEDDGHVSVFRQPSMNSNGNTIDREGRLITCEHSGRRV